MNTRAKDPNIPFTKDGLNTVAKALQRAAEIGQDAITSLDNRIKALEQKEMK